VSVTGIDHVQVAAPIGCEADARAFYGGVLGMDELPKPEAIRGRGGCWFRAGAQALHVGVEEPFDLEAIRSRLRDAGCEYEDDANISGVDRLFVFDPFGNRLELRSGV
jgi:catechol 2,3-dioxygenase-like lactoylglutathione lyase family enzyme